jgi:hypothetical protein
MMAPRLALALLLLPLTSLAQEEGVVVSKNFRFRDGVYLSHQSFRNNAPDLAWEQVQARWFANPQTFLVQMEFIRTKGGGLEISPDSLWGFTMQGIPYIRLPREWIRKELATFAPIELRGKICYFDFERLDTIKTLITAYNPNNGRPFLQGYIDKEAQSTYRKMLHFETGQVLDLTRENLLGWIGDDPELSAAVADIPESELDAKLFKCLLIYVDRKKVYVPM